MVIIKKRKKNASIDQLIKALNQFMTLLEAQEETEAVEDLGKSVESLKKSTLAKEDILAALELIHEAFEDKHELSAYTHARKETKEGTWSEADELYVASTSVLALANRIRSSLVTR